MTTHTTHAEHPACQHPDDTETRHTRHCDQAARGPMREVAPGHWDLGYTSEQVYRDGESRHYRAP